jgi:YgiT-type zinc finger domain-containing protein
MKMICTKCKEEAKRIVLDSYEYEKGIKLKDVEAYECPKCHEFIFTDKQIGEIERRTDAIKVHTFSFDRKITVSGRSLVINIPEDIIRHMKLVKGMRARLTPIDDKELLIEVK